jgi:hypothetical protein
VGAAQSSERSDVYSADPLQNTAAKRILHSVIVYNG